MCWVEIVFVGEFDIGVNGCVFVFVEMVVEIGVDCVV